MPKNYAEKYVGKYAKICCEYNEKLQKSNTIKIFHDEC